MITKVVDNFTGSLTRRNTGDMNSGFAKYANSWGYDPFTKPGNLTWLEQPSIIGADLSFPTTHAKQRFEGSSSVAAVYTYGIDQKLVKYKVNDKGSSDPDYDVGSVLGSYSAASPNHGGTMEFFGATERIYIGHDNGVASVDFTGANFNSSVTSTSSVTAGVPRPMVQFLGKLYAANGNNLIEIDSTGTVTTYAKLSPGFPVGTFVRDLDVTPDGNYLVITLSRLNGPDFTVGAPLEPVSSADSYKVYWNGTDTGYTAFNSYGGYALTSSHNFSDFSYTTGYDLGGSALYAGGKKIVSLPNITSPASSAMFSIGNMLGFMAPEYVEDDDQTKASFYMYGQYDNEIPAGLFRFLRQEHIPTSVLGVTPDITAVPTALPVSNQYYVNNAAGYTSNAAGTAKIYFTTYGQTSNSFKPYVYKFTTAPIGFGSVVGGIWESQNEVFAQKISPKNVRLYTEPLVGDNSFKIEFVDAASSVVAGKTFTVGSVVAAGDDLVRWTPQVNPQHTWGTKITNLGVVNWTGIKLEVDFEEMGT